jgi:hypothetical protein
MAEVEFPLHRHIEEVDPGWLKSEVSALARGALVAVCLSLAVGFGLSTYLSRAGEGGVMRIVVAPGHPERAAGTTSCADASSRCGKPASSR